MPRAPSSPHTPTRPTSQRNTPNADKDNATHTFVTIKPYTPITDDTDTVPLLGAPFAVLFASQIESLANAASALVNERLRRKPEIQEMLH